jgi:two-component system, response regulator PdtaR
MTERPTALVVEDDYLIGLMFSDMLEQLGFDVCGTAPSAAEAVELATRFRPDVVWMDVRLRGPVDGVAAAKAMHQNVDTRIIFITGSQEPETVDRISRVDPAAVLFKPVLFGDLRSAIRTVF